MMVTYQLAEFSSPRIFVRARQIVGGIIMLLALTLIGATHVWGQYCSPGYTGYGGREKGVWNV